MSVRGQDRRGGGFPRRSFAGAIASQPHRGGPGRFSGITDHGSGRPRAGLMQALANHLEQSNNRLAHDGGLRVQFLGRGLRVEAGKPNRGPC